MWPKLGKLGMAQGQNLTTRRRLAFGAIVIVGAFGAVALLRPLDAPQEVPIAEPVAVAAPESAVAQPPVEAATPAVVSPEPASEPAPKSDAQPEPAPPVAHLDVEAGATDARLAPMAPEPVLPSLAPPSFDVVRLAADGAALVAGRGAPGAEVTVLVDGAELSKVTVANDGGFAAMFDLPPSDAARIVALRMDTADGQVIVSADTVLLTPVPDVPALPSAPEVPDAPAVADSAPAQTPMPDTAALASATSEPVVAAPAAAPAALLLSADGEVDVLQPSGDLLAQTVVVDTIAYQEDGTVVLSGRGAAGSGTNIYLDNTLRAQAIVDAKGVWRAPLGDVAPGRYVLRVDQIAADGTVTARYETGFEREDLTTLPPVAVADPVEDVVVEPVEMAQAITDALQSSEIGDLQTQQPEAALSAKLVVDQIGYDAEGAVELSGRGLAGSQIDVMLGAERVARLQVGADGAWNLRLVDVAPGIYNLRVQQRDASGTLLDQIETPFKREDPAAVRTVAAPEMAEVGQPVLPDVTRVTVQPGFTLWRIARENYGRGILYVQVFEANRDKIRNPDLIYPGQVFTVPNPTR